MHHAVSRVVAAGNALGEGIVWDVRDQALYWTDITAATLWRHCPTTGATRTWVLPEPLACLALCTAYGWLLLGLASRLAFFNLETGDTFTICEVEPGLPTRINDGACDREGRFVFGTKHEPAGGGPSSPVGAFYRLDTDLSLHRLALGGIAIANGTAFSPDGRTLYFCDSRTHAIDCCDYSSAGEVSRMRTFVALADKEGEPDGSTVDAAGGVWNAQWDAGCITRYDAGGRETDTVILPIARPTRPALGGAGLETLFITSAQLDEPAGTSTGDGHVFALHADIPGLPEPRFAGTPRVGRRPRPDQHCLPATALRGS